jgi:hypothetical protein
VEKACLAVAFGAGGRQYIRVTASIDGQLRFAIAGKRVIEVTYKGSVRLVEPHDYGVQKGTVRLFAYQVRSSFVPPGKSAIGWRMLDVPKIEKCVVTDQMFKGSRGTADQDHNVWDELYARVK